MGLVKFGLLYLKNRKYLYCSKEKIMKLQRKRLNRIIKYAYKNSKFYNDYYTQMGIRESDLEDGITFLPPVDKNMIFEHFDEVLTVDDLKGVDFFEFDKSDNELLKNKYHIIHSSGTTGTPRYYVYDDKAWTTMLVGLIRGALIDVSLKEAIKLVLSKPKILYIAATDGRYAGALAVNGGIKMLGFDSLFLDVNRRLEDLLDELDDFQPDIIIGYPTAINIVTRALEDRNKTLKVKRVISCGEPLNLNLREYFSSVYNCSVINFYGASESLSLGSEYDNSGIYLFDDMNYIEILDDGIYLTCLYNYTMPLIRYRMNDIIDLNSIDSNLTNVKTILGRYEDVMWFNNNGKKEFIHPLSIEGFCCPGMVDYQFVKNGDEALRIRVVSDGNKDEIKSVLENGMYALLWEKGLNVNINVEFVDTISPDVHTGKKRLVVIED